MVPQIHLHLAKANLQAQVVKTLAQLPNTIGLQFGALIAIITGTHALIVINDAAKDKAPYKVTNYIHTLAELVHAFYNECRVIDQNNLELSGSRLALVKASKIVLKNALALIGVSAPIHM